MKTFLNHLNFFKEVKEQLESNKKDVYFIVSSLMQYLEKNHLLEKHYIEKMREFVKIESNKDMIKDQSIETLLMLLTVIYRTDYMSPDNDTYIMYERNGMIPKILDTLIEKIEELV